MQYTEAPGPHGLLVQPHCSTVPHRMLRTARENQWCFRCSCAERLPYLPYSYLSSYSDINIYVMAEQLHVNSKGSSMEGVTGKGNLLLTAADDKGNAVSHSSRKNPKKLQCSPENLWAIGYDKSLFSSLVSPPQTRTCHHCGLSGSLRCSQCKQIYYCSVDCQKKDWSAHRVVCEPIKENVSKKNRGKLPAKTEKGVYLKGRSTSVESLEMEEHIEKIMLSDLQTLGIKKAMEVQGMVTEFKSPREFYIQMSSPEVLDRISKLSVKLQACYANTVIEEQYSAVKGEVCVARCSLDQTWNRALIKDVDILKKKAQVFYIDCGKEENIPISWVKALHKDVELLVPPCAIKCSFANYDPKEERWNEGITSISSQLMGKHCSITVVDILQEEIMLSFAVDAAFTNAGDYLNKVPLETKSHVTPGSIAKGVDSPRVSENSSKGSQEEIPQDEELFHFVNPVAECISVCVGEVFSGLVSYVQNPESFFCQQMYNACQLAEIQVALNEHGDKFPSDPAFHPVLGNLYCAQFTGDNLWYRAAVTAYVSEDTVLVSYVDYGNFEALPLTRLHPMIPRLMDIPAQAIRCTLAGVKPPEETWTSKAISFMKQLVEDKVLIVKVVDKEDCKCVVELVDASVTPAIDLSSHLIEKGYAAVESKVALPVIKMSAKQADGEYKHVLLNWCYLTSYGNMPRGQDRLSLDKDTVSERIFKWSKLTLEQTVDVIVCVLYSPGEFYCQISNNRELLALKVLNKSLSEYCQKTPPDVFKPQNGEPCCAFSSDDGNWYRALVQNVTSDGTVEVCFVDYGNVEKVPLDKIRHISPSFLKLPFQGIKCWLSGIKLGDSKWTEEATARFHMYAAGVKLQARVTSLSRDGAGVELIDNSTGHPKVINEILMSEKLAVKEVPQDEKNFPNKSVDTIGGKLVTCIFLLFQLETSLEHWKSIELAIGESLTVCVTEIVSPDLFYAVPVQTKDQEKLHRQLVELENYCKSCKSQPFKPKQGEACCAKFSGDGRWCRALVLKASQSAVEVLYADHGNIETLPLSEVLPITDSYLELPFQTIVCSLAGIEKAETSPLLLDKLKEMLLNKYVTITVKGINGNVNLVTVEKNYENSSLNVADKLVMEGLVKSSGAENLHTEHQGSGGETKCCCTELKMQVRFSPHNTWGVFVFPEVKRKPV
ncbi:tudor domain-containing protein 1 [Porphyrio hochstetteri]